MKLLLHPVFLLCLGVFLVEQLLESFSVYISYVHAYLDDVCAMPVILTLASVLMSVIYFGRQSKNLTFRLSAFQVIMALVYCAVLFEVLLPRMATKYIADYWDILAYSFGAFIYYKLINPAQTLPIK